MFSFLPASARAGLIALCPAHGNAAGTCYELSDVRRHCDFLAAGGIFDDDRVPLALDGCYDGSPGGLLHMDTFFGIPFAVEDGRVRIVDEHPVWKRKVTELPPSD